MNSVEGNQQQQEGLFKANTSNCRRSPPSSGGAERRRRDEVDYCRNDDAPTIRPARLQQEGEVRPSGNLGGQSKPGNNLLVKPEEGRPEWAPSLSDFFVTDPCQKRPYRVCAPYVPGRDFEEWTSTAHTLFVLDLTACDFYK